MPLPATSSNWHYLQLLFCCQPHPFSTCSLFRFLSSKKLNITLPEDLGLGKVARGTSIFFYHTLTGLDSVLQATTKHQTQKMTLISLIVKYNQVSSLHHHITTPYWYHQLVFSWYLHQMYTEYRSEGPVSNCIVYFVISQHHVFEKVQNQFT